MVAGALSGHSLSLGYQKTTGESDFPYINDTADKDETRLIVSYSIPLL